MRIRVPAPRQPPLVNASRKPVYWSMPARPLIKALTDAGLGSRRKMTDAIKQGRVEVNGVPAESFNHPVDPARDSIFLDGRKVDLSPRRVIVLALNKPEGVLSTAADDRGRATVLDILPEKYRKHRLYPVGRLDMDTTGLILLTNDGDLTYKLTHPHFEQEKEYLVHTDGPLQPAELRAMEKGIELEDGRTAPVRVARLRTGPYRYRVVIHEGRKRQVRRMFEHFGRRVTALRRVRIGNLLLGDLPEGEVRPLTNREVKTLLAPQPRPGFSRRGPV
jgi:23S rRNA pseudouridine2605 synthase